MKNKKIFTVFLCLFFVLLFAVIGFCANSNIKARIIGRSLIVLKDGELVKVYKNIFTKNFNTNEIAPLDVLKFLESNKEIKKIYKIKQEKLLFWHFPIKKKQKITYKKAVHKNGKIFFVKDETVLEEKSDIVLELISRFLVAVLILRAGFNVFSQNKKHKILRLVSFYVLTIFMFFALRLILFPVNLFAVGFLGILIDKYILYPKNIQKKLTLLTKINKANQTKTTALILYCSMTPFATLLKSEPLFSSATIDYLIFLYLFFALSFVLGYYYSRN